MTRTITPTSAANMLRIDGVFNGSPSTRQRLLRHEGRNYVPS